MSYDKKWFILGLVLIGVGLIWYGQLLLTITRPQLINAREVEDKPEEAANNTLVYSSIGVEAPLVITSNKDPLIVQDWPAIKSGLRQGVVVSFLSDSFAKTQFAYVIGHSSDTYPHRFSSIFAGLGQSRKGDAIKLTIDNLTYQFEVIDRKIIEPNDVSAFQEIEKTGSQEKRIALVTCWPLLTTKNRLVVIAQQK